MTREYKPNQWPPPKLVWVSVLSWQQRSMPVEHTFLKILFNDLLGSFYVCTCPSLCVEVRGHLEASVLLFHCVDPGDWTWVIRFNRQHLFLQGHLTGTPVPCGLGYWEAHGEETQNEHQVRREWGKTQGGGHFAYWSSNLLMPSLVKWGHYQWLPYEDKHNLFTWGLPIALWDTYYLQHWCTPK